MTKSVADKTPISATLRRHVDPPGMWVSILLCSAMLHASAFLILRSLNFDSFKPKRLSSSIPIEIVQLPKRQTRTTRIIARQQPQTPRRLASKPVVVKPQATTPQPPPPAVQPQLVKPVIPETQQRDTIAFTNPSITKKTPIPKIQPSIKPKIEQKTSPKSQVNNQTQQRQQQIAQQQRQQELKEQQRQQRISQQQQRQQELEEQQRQQRIAQEERRNASGGEKLSPPPNVNKTSPGGGTKINPGENISLGEGKALPGVGEFLTATSSVPSKDEQEQALKVTLNGTYARLIGNNKKSLRSLDRELITQPINCPVWLFIDDNGNISEPQSGFRGIQVIPKGITEPQRVLCQKYAQEYFKDAKFEPAIDKDGKKPPISQLLVNITIQPNIGANTQSP